jgi:dATP/dGTP diphosphohydrolase
MPIDAKTVTPIVALVPLDVAADLEEAAARIGHPVTPEMVANGWTWEMLLAGRLLVVSAAEPHETIDAVHLQRQREWSTRSFGPGARTLGVVDHIRKELREILADPTDLNEWVDVVILALDGAWRCGAEPQQIIDAIKAKQAKNEQRTWPDWRTAPADQAIEHVRDAELSR